jgi:hypothetical protein
MIYLLLFIPFFSIVILTSVYHLVDFNLNTIVIALVFSLLVFLHLLSIMILFDPSGTRYQLGIDGVSLWLVWLVG